MRKVQALGEEALEPAQATRAAHGRARELRRDVTATEQSLWPYLRGRALAGFKFRRQHPIGRFIADFYCAEARLVIELDGSVHDTTEQQERDKNREDVLTALRNVTLLRFTNEEVQQNIQAVIAAVQKHLATEEPPTTNPNSGR